MSLPVKGWIGRLRIATTDVGLTTNVTGITNVSPNLTNNVTAAYELGSRLPQAVLEGNIKLDMTITRFYIDNTWFNYAYSATAQTAYYVRIYPQGDGTGMPYVEYLGKFSSWKLTEAQANEVTEQLTFEGSAVSIGTA